MAKKNLTLGEIIEYAVLGLSVILIVVVYTMLFKELTKTQIVPVSPDEGIYVSINNRKPSYEYLKSTTVYMVHPLSPLKILGVQVAENDFPVAAGTGVVVAEKNDEYYILTNKHICEADKENCFISPSGKREKKGLVQLTYVRSASDKEVDLELWKVAKSQLPDNRPVKGFSATMIQESVYSVGNYLGMPFIYTEGTRAGMDGDNELYNMPCVFGCSGSGIFNSYGELVGLIFAGNSVPTTIPIIGSFDTAKAVAVSGYQIRLFLGDLTDEANH